MTCSGKYAELDWVGPLVLCEEEVGRLPPWIPGVYILHTYDARRGWYPPLYAGKAALLGRRLMQHLGSGATAPEIRLVRARLRLYFSAAPVFDGDDLDALEAGLVHVLRPPFNRQVPKAAPLYSNLPPMILERRMCEQLRCR